MKIKEKELEILNELCKENDLNTKGVYQIIRQAEKMSYENVSDRARRKEYSDLIEFHLRRDN
jgi:hypothetical protein